MGVSIIPSLDPNQVICTAEMQFSKKEVKALRAKAYCFLLLGEADVVGDSLPFVSTV